MRATRSLRTRAENASENQSSGLSEDAFAVRKRRTRRRTSRAAMPSSTPTAHRPSGASSDGLSGAANCSDTRPPSQMTGSTSKGDSL